MTWFGKDRPTKSIEDTVKVTQADPSESEDYYSRVIVPMVDAEKEKILAQQDAVIEIFEKDHQGQLSGFDFSCIRHGDFLTLFVTRDYNRHYDHPYETKFSTTLNLGLVKRIHLEEGRGVGHSWTTSIFVVEVREDHPDHYGSHHPVSLRKPPEKGFVHRVISDSNITLYPRPFTNDPPAEYIDRNRRFLEAILNTPNQARDDRISFYDIDSFLLVPFGKGKEVHDIIMKAIESGYEPKASILTS